MLNNLISNPYHYTAPKARERITKVSVNTDSPSIKQGTWNIPEHSGTSNDYDDYEKKGVKLNFGLADVTIWSAQIGQVT